MESDAPSLEVRTDDNLLTSAEVAILVPADAPDSPSKLTALVAGSDASAKHAFYALSQIALLSFEDEELPVHLIPSGEIMVVKKHETDTPVADGMIILRDTSGEVHVFAHDSVDCHRLLKFAHLHCTRWIRLDI